MWIPRKFPVGSVHCPAGVFMTLAAKVCTAQVAKEPPTGVAVWGATASTSPRAGVHEGFVHSSLCFMQ